MRAGKPVAEVEINASPGFEGIERAKGIHVARAAISAGARLAVPRTRP